MLLAQAALPDRNRFAVMLFRLYVALLAKTYARPVVENRGALRPAGIGGMLFAFQSFDRQSLCSESRPRRRATTASSSYVRVADRESAPSRITSSIGFAWS
jgi:hypothetical protein